MADVLLVDEDPRVVGRNAAALEAAGHTVRTAATSADALDQISRTLPDVIVTEAMLDGAMGGFDLVRTLSRRYPEVPRIMLTRVDDFMTSKQLASQDRDGWLPVHRYLQKPVMPAVLVYEVEHLVAEAAEAAA